MKVNFKKSLLVAALGFVSMAVLAGNPNGGGGSGVDQTARNAASTAQLTADTNTANIATNTTDIAGITSGSSPAIGTSKDGGLVACNITSGFRGMNLIISPADDAASISWSGNNTTSAEAGMFTNGFENSIKVWLLSNTTKGVVTCLGKSYGGKTDWYLPSIFELRCIQGNANTLNTNGANLTLANTYWSSTETDTPTTKAYSMTFNTSALNKQDKSTPNSVRCVRKFNS